MLANSFSTTKLFSSLYFLRAAALFSTLLFLTACRFGGVDAPSASSSPAVSPSPLPAEIPFANLELSASPLARQLLLADIVPEINLSSEWGQIRASWSLTAAQIKLLPADSMLQVWLIDEADGHPASSFSVGDTVGGEPFLAFSYNRNPHPQLLGVLLPIRGEDGKPIFNDGKADFQLIARHRNRFDPYDRVLITLETAVSSPEFNPRPAATLWSAVIANPQVTNRVLPRIPNAPVVMYGDTDITTLQSLPWAEKMGIKPQGQEIKLSKAYGKSWITLNFDTPPELPVGAVLEAWLVDYDSRSAHDKQSGPAEAPWDEEDFVFSLGKLLEQPRNPDQPESRSYTSVMSANTPMATFDAVLITLETDGNEENYDPRPGIPLFMEKL